MEPVRRRRYGSCRDCGWIYELVEAPRDCATCGAGLGERSRAEPARAWTAARGRAAAGGDGEAAGSVSPGPSSERSEARSDEGPGERRATRPFQRALYAADGQAHVASRVKVSAASARAPWAERLASELDARHAARRPDARLHVTSPGPLVHRADARVVPGGHDTTMDALAELGGLRLSPSQVAARATLLGGLMVALLAWIIL